MRRRSARQIAASRRNLVIARKKRHRGRKIAKYAAIGVGVGTAAYLGTREIRGTNTYHKNRAKARNITTRYKKGTRTVVISKAEYRFIKHADAVMGDHESPNSRIKIDRKVKENIYGRKLRSRQNRKDVFAAIDRSYKEKKRTTFRSRHAARVNTKIANANLRKSYG